MPKCDFNKVAKQLYSPVTLLHNFRTLSLKNISGRLLLTSDLNFPKRLIALVAQLPNCLNVQVLQWVSAWSVLVFLSTLHPTSDQVLLPLNFLNYLTARRSHRRCSMKKGVLRNFAKFTENHQNLFSIKLKAWDRNPSTTRVPEATTGGTPWT